MTKAETLAALKNQIDSFYSLEQVIKIVEGIDIDPKMETITRLKVLQELADIIIAKNEKTWSKSSDDRIEKFQAAYNNEQKLIKLLTPKA